MRSGRLRRLPAERRARLVEVAAREFADRGFAAASLNTIVTQCGMSKSSFYYIFESKEELFDFVVTESVAKLAAAIPVPAAEEFAAGDFWARAEALLAAFAHTAAQDATLLDVGRMFYRAAPDTARSPVTATHVRAHTWVRDVLAVGRRRGAVRDDLPEDLQSDLAFGVLQIFDRWSVNHLDELDNARTAALTAAQLAALRRLLAP